MHSYSVNDLIGGYIMQNLFRYTLVIVFSMFLFSACNGIEPQMSLDSPVGSLTVKLDHQGKVKFSVTPGFSLPTPLGTVRMGVGVEITPQDFSDVDNILIIEHDGITEVYDLRGQNFNVNFKEGYYRKISLNVQTDTIKLVVISGDSPELETSPNEEENQPPAETSYRGCANAPAIRVAVNQQARVCTIEHLLLRVEPDADADHLYRIKPDHIVDILDGPVCDESKQWNYWKVRLENGMVGWVSEGSDERLEYFLCPIE